MQQVTEDPQTHSPMPSELDVEIVIPVHNEERTLTRAVYRLHDFLSRRLPFTWQITIADNASTVLTPEIAEALTASLDGVEVLRLEQKGRGRALRTAWSASSARVVAYAVRADAIAELLPGIRDEGWFFDTELLVLAQRGGMRIHEVPVDWVDDPDSRVDIVTTALEDLRGVARLALAAPITRFIGIGIASTLAYALLFLALAGAIGSTAASATALALTAVANTAANRRLTFGIQGRRHLGRQHLAAFLVFVIALGLTNGALAVVHGLDPHPTRLIEAAALVLANLAATLTRYAALSTWVFRVRPLACRHASFPSKRRVVPRSSSRSR